MKLANKSFVFTFTEEKLQWKIEYKDNRDHIEIRDNGKTLKKDAVYNNVPIKLLNTCSEKIKRTYKTFLSPSIQNNVVRRRKNSLNCDTHRILSEIDE